MTTPRLVLCLFILLATSALVPSSDAFAPTLSSLSPLIQHQRVSTTKPFFLVDPSASSSIEISAATLDPTTVLSDILGGLLGTPAILLVPIVAALGLASLIAFFIVSYANPEVEDDEK